MIVSFADRGTEDVYDGTNSRRARKTCPKEIWTTARRRLSALDAATGLDDLSAVPGHRLEKLRGDRQGQYSIAVNMQWRICFRWTDRGATDVGITDYHG